MKIGHKIIYNVQEYWKNFFSQSCYAWCLVKYFTNEEDLAEMASLFTHR